MNQQILFKFTLIFFLILKILNLILYFFQRLHNIVFLYEQLNLRNIEIKFNFQTLILFFLGIKHSLNNLSVDQTYFDVETSQIVFYFLLRLRIIFDIDVWNEFQCQNPLPKNIINKYYFILYYDVQWICQFKFLNSLLLLFI